jgi:hypothetical protein
VERRIECMIVEANASWDSQYTVQVQGGKSVQDKLLIFTTERCVKNDIAGN